MSATLTIYENCESIYDVKNQECLSCLNVASKEKNNLFIKYVLNHKDVFDEYLKFLNKDNLNFDEIANEFIQTIELNNLEKKSHSII